MGAIDNKSSLEQAIGNAQILRVINPTIRGSARRTDPDGSHASPFFSSLTSKTLIVTVTPVGDITITFTSDLMADAISTINAASSANLKAFDEDGYLRITNLNTGNKNSLIIKGGTATTLLGFIVGPEPGSSSFAGEIATSSPGRSLTNIQNNPQGTHLVANDEDLTSGVINRSIVGAIEHAERLVRDLDREIPVVKKIAVTTITLPTTAERAFVITDPTIRFPVDGFELTVTNPTGLILDQLVRIKSFPDDIDVYDIAQTDPVPHISKVIYNNGSLGISDTTQTFATWGTPDGRSIFNSQLRNKQPPVTITKIRGNVIEAPTAAFVTNIIQVGDTLIIESANNNTPFNHNGEYVVTAVIDGTRVAVRAKGSTEKTYVTTSIPTELNANLPGGTTYGTVRVIIGSYIPATALTFVVPSWIPTASSFYVHIYRGVRIRDLLPGDVGTKFSVNDEEILSILRTHITTATGFRHHSIDVDAAAITSTPHSLSSGTVASQIIALLGLINSTIASEVAYGGGATWADGTTNPATTVESQLDKIITDLAGAAGTAKIQGAVVGTDLAVGTLAAQLSNLAVNWLKMSRANTISGAQTFSAVITAAAGLVASVNQNITVSGTGDYKHGDRVLTINGIYAAATNGWVGISSGANGSTLPFAQCNTVGTNLGITFPLKEGDRVKGVTCVVASNTTVTVVVRVFSSIPTGATQIAGITITHPSNTWTVVPITGLTTTTVPAGGEIFLQVDPGSSTGFQLATISVTFDRP